MNVIKALCCVTAIAAIRGQEKQEMTDSKKAEMSEIMSFAENLNKLKAFAAAALELKKQQ